MSNTEFSSSADPIESYKTGNTAAKFNQYAKIE